MPEMNEIINELKSQFFCVDESGDFVCVHTGEIFSKEEYAMAISSSVAEYQKQQEKTALENGVIPIVTVKPIRRPSIKQKVNYDNGVFNMSYRGAIEEILSLNLNSTEKLVYLLLREFMVQGNYIELCGDIPTYETLSNKMQISLRTFKSCVKVLEEKLLVKTKMIGHKKAIYINPKYYASSKRFKSEVFEMFGLEPT